MRVAEDAEAAESFEKDLTGKALRTQKTLKRFKRQKTGKNKGLKVA